jgi:uncharacterized membrane protein
MARVRMFLAAALAAAALAVVAVPASASAAVPEANTAKFCKAVTKIGSTNSSSQPTKSQAKSLVKQFKNAAKYAPKNVKSAIGKISSYLNAIAGADVTDLANLAKSGTYQGYAKAIVTYSTYVATNC